MHVSGSYPSIGWPASAYHTRSALQIIELSSQEEERVFLLEKPPGEKGRRKTSTLGQMRSPSPFPLSFLRVLALGYFLQGANAVSCPGGWMAYNNHCYGLFYEKLTWKAAEAECQGYGINGHLASILSWAENEVVSSHITNNHKNIKYVWIGLHNVMRMKVFKWTDRSPKKYTAWADFEPAYSVLAKVCVHLLNYKEYKQWASVKCDEKASYLCKFTST
nr:C-type lectin BpLec-like isoform X2 [Pogona vitticeps]